MNNSNLVHVIAIDDVGGVVVSEDKVLLTRELVKHYTATWKEKAEEEERTGCGYNLLHDVSAMLASLSIQHCVFTGTTEMFVLGPAFDAGTPDDTNDGAYPPYDTEPPYDSDTEGEEGLGI